MARYVITIFLSSFLLFQVQPLIGKCILPWFGGTPAVWTTCMLFFQAALVIGYAYAHGNVRWLKPRAQFFCHLALLAATVVLLPITPSAALKPTGTGNPTAYIFLLLMLTVGGPYFVLASTAPLLQSWFSRVHPGRSPYWLYALSNAGSLLGLFAYPFVVERWLTLQAQTIFWSGAYGVFLVMCAICGLDMWRLRADSVPPPNTPDGSIGSSSSAADSSPRAGTIGLWLALSACGSVMLLATTNRMCQDVASVPFLWVLPLGLYLLSFIILFGREQWYRRQWFAVAMMLAVLAAVFLTLQALTLHLVVQIILYSFILTITCFVCHGELVHLKPPPRYLTSFYLTISVGGALGGALVTLVAPLVFTGFYEFNAGLVSCLILMLLLYRRDRWRGLKRDALRKQLWVTAAGAVVVGSVTIALMWALSTTATRPGETYLARKRNFYGALRVVRRDQDSQQYRRIVMVHGNTTHGVQFDLPGHRQEPTLYYNRDSGVGLAIEQHPAYQRSNRPLRMGVVGLGAGTLCCYARRGDVVRFYEIDPLVCELSQEHFTYRSDAKQRGADVDVLLGDARIVMTRQLAQQQPQQFDVLVIDAFSSDSIPLHLLTVECFEIYGKHLHPDGILAVHVSNRHLDLRPAVMSLGERYRYEAISIEHPPDDQLLQRGLEFAAGRAWVILTRNEEFLANETIQRVSQPWPQKMQPVVLTDDFSSLFQLLRW